MRLRKRSRSRTPRRTARRVVKRRKRSTVSKATKKYVKRAINSSDITRIKQTNPLQTDEVNFDGIMNINQSGGYTGGNVFPLCPVVEKGAGLLQRTEQRIRMISHTIELLVRFKPSYAGFVSQADQNDLMARIIVFQPKILNNRHVWDGVTPQNRQFVMDNLLFADNYDGVPYDGTYTNHDLPLNSKRIKKIWDKKFLVKGPYTSLLTVGAPEDGFDVENTKVPTFRFRIRIPVNKILRYPDDAQASDDFPVNYNPVIAFGFTNMNPALNPDVSQRMNVQMKSFFKWKNM